MDAGGRVKSCDARLFYEAFWKAVDAVRLAFRATKSRLALERTYLRGLGGPDGA